MDARDREREDFLQKYYHHLVRCIQPSSFYSWLRGKKVITEDEQEEIEAKYQIRSLRAGYLIDLIMRKGESGYVAFMECVEYLYPDLYRDITGKKPKDPPKSFEPAIRQGSSIRRRNTNSDALCLMANLLQNLTQDVLTKKLQLQELQKQFESDCQKEECEKDLLFGELDITREKNQELLSDNEELKKKLQTAVAEREAAQKRCQELLVEKDKYFKQCNQLRGNVEKMGSKVEELHDEVRRERSVPFGMSQLETYKKENRELKEKLQLHMQKCKPSSQLSNGDIKSSVNEVSYLNSHINELEQKITDLTVENSSFRVQCSDLEEMLGVLQKHNDETQNSIKQFVAERDQYQSLCKDLKAQLEDNSKRNEELNAQCGLYLGRICAQSERIQYLDEEIDRLKREAGILRGVKSKIHVSCPAANADTLSIPRNGCASPTSPLLRNPGAEPNDRFTKKREGSYETLGKYDPLVIFAPREIEPLLFQHLKKHFNICEFSTVDSTTEEGASVAISTDMLVWERSPTTYSFIDRSSLQKKRNTVVLSIPCHCVRKMKEQLKINPIVIVVKYKSGSSIPEYTPVEEILNRPNAIKYNIITVKENFRTNFTGSDADSLIMELERVIRNENSLRQHDELGSESHS